MELTADFYLVVTYNRARAFSTRELSLKVTKQSPSLGRDEIAVKCSISLSKSLFETPVYEASIKIPEAAKGADVDVELVNGIETLVKQNLGVDLKIGVGDE